ncbi:MAG: hypothetical protein H7Y88_08110 [Phycisphaerales bacterium]|nr:hypothetical protein [Phycisphaerales bacterium]
MLRLKAIDRVCYGACMVTIILGITVCIALIWVSSEHETLWRGLATLGVIFAGSVLTMSVNQMISRRLAPSGA